MRNITVILGDKKAVTVLEFAAMLVPYAPLNGEGNPSVTMCVRAECADPAGNDPLDSIDIEKTAGLHGLVIASFKKKAYTLVTVEQAARTMAAKKIDLKRFTGGKD